MWRVLRPVLGVVCLIIGFLALVTPMTPGAFLLLVGLELLGLGFLIPRPVRSRWEIVKSKSASWIRERIALTHRWLRKHRILR